MGLLDWFRPRRPFAITCWLDEDSRLGGLCAAVAADLTAGKHVLVVGQFKAALVRTGAALAAAGVPFATRDRWTAADTAALAGPPTGAAVAVLAAALPDVPEGRPKAPAARAAATVSVRLCDLHVLPDANERVRRFAASLPVSATCRADVSFDDPLMRSFAKPWVQSMVSALGMKADEPIDSPMVTRGLERALRKLARRATGNVPADSLDEWLERNLPQ